MSNRERGEKKDELGSGGSGLHEDCPILWSTVPLENEPLVRIEWERLLFLFVLPLCLVFFMILDTIALFFCAHRPFRGIALASNDTTQGSTPMQVSTNTTTHRVLASNPVRLFFFQLFLLCSSLNMYSLETSLSIYV